MEKVSVDTIAWSIVLTLGFTFGFYGLVYETKALPIPTLRELSPWLIIPADSIAHPIVGKILCMITEALCRGIDAVYGNSQEGDKWGNWEIGPSLIFAATWPVSAPIGLTITSIVLLWYFV